MDKKGGGRECHNFPLKNCCLTVPENFVGEPFCVSENFRYRKKLWIRRGKEGVSQFSIKNLLSHRTGKFRKGTLLCLAKFRVSKNILHEGSSTISCRLCLTVPKNFVREPFYVSEKIWYRKIFWIKRAEGGSVTIFHRKFVVSQYRKTS